MPMTTTLASRLRGDTSRGARRSIRQRRSHYYRDDVCCFRSKKSLFFFFFFFSREEKRVRAFLRNKSRERDLECRTCDGDYFDDILKLVFFKTSSLCFFTQHER